MIDFTTPVRRGVKCKAAVSGPTGSGKTRGLLAFASGLVGRSGRIGLINTERDGTAFQIGNFNWKQYDFYGDAHGNYDPRWLEGAIGDVSGGQLDCLIVDSLSLFWDGPGGMLEMKDRIDKTGRNRNQWANWGEVTKIGRSLMDAALTADLHILLSLRAERKHKEVETVDYNGNKRKEVVALGWRPVFRYRHLYDPHCIWMLNGPEEEADGIAPCHSLWYFKDRAGFKKLFPDDKFLTEDFGRRVGEYLAGRDSLDTDGQEMVFHAQSGAAQEKLQGYLLRCVNEYLLLHGSAGIDTPCIVTCAAKPFMHKGKAVEMEYQGRKLPVYETREWQINADND